VLDSLQNGVISRQGNMNIVKKDGQLAYSAAPGDAKTPTGITGYNTVATPRGGQYQLVLPDGSKVWLNAASSIRYPTVFNGTERQVDITGEAYFEVASLHMGNGDKKMPFIVNANGTKVQVLGTHFNVMAYDDEGSIKTTLLEGSVKITQGAQSSLLTPGHQAQVNRASGHLSESEVNTDLAVAWKDGYFYFDRDDIKTIMRQVARWYSLDIAYEGKVSEDLFSGKIERRLPLSGILHLLERGNIHYRIEMNTLTIVQ
jgi:ferric-dicitrate binding protein FerR (iron transport regulator)